VADFPVTLDNLITHVQALHQDGTPLERLSDAVTVAGRLAEQSDALIGHFVDQARRSGASWSQIGESMGVTKQAAQKRFVPTGANLGAQLFTRFTPRARGALAAARSSAADAPVGAGHIVAGLLSEPDGLAAKIMVGGGRTAAKIRRAFGIRAVRRGDTDPAALRGVVFADDGKALLRAAFEAALRLGHNYIGTEHLLLGALLADGDARHALQQLGITVEYVEAGIADELDRIRAAQQADG
jgi:ATPases with chaperone activity, ATP-binding subunit